MKYGGVAVDNQEFNIDDIIAEVNAGFATDSPTQQAYADDGELLHKRKSFRAEDPQKANKAKPAKKKKEKEVIACLKEKYPDMDNATLKEVLNCVIF